jgi:penicillin-binding protein 1C
MTLRWAVRLSGFALAAWLGLQTGLRLTPYPGEMLRSQEDAGPLRLEDRHGRLLFARSADAGAHGAPSHARPGRGRFVGLDEIAPEALLVVLASEDRRFFEHSGVDLSGVFRAAYLNLRAGRIAYGGSTITMQLARMVHSKDSPRTLPNKLREALVALRMERALSKREILAHYLNRAFYGHGSYGIEEAALRYFGKPAAALSAGEATFLAVIPRAPSYYDPIRHPGRLLARRDRVLARLVKDGQMSSSQAERIRAEQPRPTRPAAPFLAPHFVDFVLSALPKEAQARGGTLRTTLDLSLQEAMEARVREHLAGLEDRRVTQAGLIVLDTGTGEVLAMVGSGDYFARGGEGQVNIMTSRRHPGSALKPFLYALAIERGDSPATVAFDVNNLEGSAYRLLQVTQRERGPVPYREALAGSYNLAAVHVLERVGVSALLSRLRRAGLGPLQGTDQDYGLQLALGSPRLRPLDLAAGYGFIAREGRVVRPRLLMGRSRSDGTLRSLDGRLAPLGSPDMDETINLGPPAQDADVSLFSPQVAWLLADILSEPGARRPMFGEELAFDLPFPVAAKTGTSQGFADTIAVGVTREVTVVAWAGNFDGRPTHGLGAMQAAAPLVRAALLHVSAGLGRPLTLPAPPEGIVTVEVCPLSGLRPGPQCPNRRRERFHEIHVPEATCAWHLPAGTSPGQARIAYPEALRHWLAQR